MPKEAILYVGLCQSIFAALVLFTQRQGAPANRILAFCLLFIAARFLAKIYETSDLVHPHGAWSLGIIPLTMGPYLYLYVKYFTHDDLKFEWRDLLHFLPFLIFIVLHQGVFEGEISLAEEHFFAHDRFFAIRVMIGMAFFTSILVYTIFTNLQLFSYHKSERVRLNRTSEKKTLLWLAVIVGLFAIIFVTYFVLGLINILTFSIQYDLVYISSIGLIVLAYAVSYFGIRQPALTTNFYDRGEQQLSGSPAEAANMRVSLGPKNENNASQIMLAEALEAYMEEEKPYLNPDLTLADLSEKLRITKGQLTHLLNNHIGANFFTYVNEYRLAETLRKLEDPSKQHLTILSIAYDCGFNSKSTFNSIFKQSTGVTPSSYRKKAAVNDV